MNQISRHESCRQKTARFKNHVAFSLRCKHEGLLPGSLVVRSPIDTDLRGDHKQPKNLTLTRQPSYSRLSCGYILSFLGVCFTCFVAWERLGSSSRNVACIHNCWCLRVCRNFSFFPARCLSKEIHCYSVALTAIAASADEVITYPYLRLTLHQ